MSPGGAESPQPGTSSAGVGRVITACEAGKLSSDCCLQRLIKQKLISSACSVRNVAGIARASFPLAFGELIPGLACPTHGATELPGRHQHLWHLQIIEIKLPERWFQMENEQGAHQPQVALGEGHSSLLPHSSSCCSSSSHSASLSASPAWDRTEQNRTGQNSSVYFS